MASLMKKLWDKNFYKNEEKESEERIRYGYYDDKDCLKHKYLKNT